MRTAALYLENVPEGVDAESIPKIIELNREVTAFGRSKAQCDVTFDSLPKVLSRLHVSILKGIDGGLLVRDEASTNGTYINGRRLERNETKAFLHGDILSFGPYQTTGGSLRFKVSSEPDELEEETDKEECAPDQVRKKRRLSETAQDGSCAFLGLIQCIKNNAKKLCAAAGCEEKQVLAAAADAACTIVEMHAKQVQGATEKCTEDNTHERDLSLRCLPLLDKEGDGRDCYSFRIASSSSSGPYSTPTQEECSSSSEAVPSSCGADISKRFSELQSNLVCPICQDHFLNTSTLECGHSYCEPCVNQWLSKCLSCPVCRSPVEKPPVRSRTIDNFVETTLRTSEQSWKQMEQRKEEYEQACAKEQDTTLQLSKALCRAREKGQTLVHIARPWSEEEQCRFLRCLRCYNNSSREHFCSSVGLTRCFIARATMKELVVAARNVRLGSRDKNVNADHMEDSNLRNRLSLFVQYC